MQTREVSRWACVLGEHLGKEEEKSWGVIGIEVYSDCPTPGETGEKSLALDGDLGDWNKNFLRLIFWVFYFEAASDSSVRGALVIFISPGK